MKHGNEYKVVLGLCIYGQRQNLFRVSCSYLHWLAITRLLSVIVFWVSNWTEFLETGKYHKLLKSGSFVSPAYNMSKLVFDLFTRLVHLFSFTELIVQVIGIGFVKVMGKKNS